MKRNKSTLEWQVKNQAYRIYTCSKQRAKTQGLEFSLTVEDIIIPEYCPYLGMKLTNILGSGRQMSNASIDRIDPSIGYVKENVQIISDLANRMKQNATPEQLKRFALGVFRMYKELKVTDFT